MKAFRFSLQRVFNYRETIEEALLAELAEIRSAYDREMNRLNEIVSTRRVFYDAMKSELACGNPEYIRRAYHFLEDLSQQVQTQETAVKKLAQKKETKTAEVVEASKDRKVLERLRDFQAEKHTRQSLREEQGFLDDLAGIGHQRKRQAS
jgi:flagellar FliJ protein